MQNYETGCGALSRGDGPVQVHLVAVGASFEPQRPSGIGVDGQTTRVIKEAIREKKREGGKKREKDSSSQPVGRTKTGSIESLIWPLSLRIRKEKKRSKRIHPQVDAKRLDPEPRWWEAFQGKAKPGNPRGGDLYLEITVNVDG